MTDRIANLWGARTPFGRDEPWPVRVDQFLEEGVSEDEVDRWVQTASILHSNGDALDLGVKDGRVVGVRGRAVDRVNKGRLDPKDLYGWQANASPDRLTRPLVREGGRRGELVETDWEMAMGRIVERSKRQLENKGPLSFGFYTTGQLFIEEYYTLGVIGKAGLGTPHMDGNTRLCTATSAQALKETFGADGQPGTYADIDHADAIMHFGHNIAETAVVTWMRVLDRLDGPDPPKLIVVDPRRTPAAERADVHLPIKNGTNLALLNAFLHEILDNGWYDRDYVDSHTIGFEELERTVAGCTPEWAAEICGVEAADIREASRILGTTERLLSTALEGVYQSNQATASACQINNLHLLRGMVGRPGCGVLQMNGQPTAQNTRETGADGDLPAFRNWDNMEHVRQLAELWNVDEMKIPHWSPPTHAMQIWRYAEQGSINLLWISCTNPAVSLPELNRIRDILDKEDLFVVVQDIFLTETARHADVVLPAGTWGEKTGTYTNTDRTVHLSEGAVAAPGEARHDLDYARRMDFRDKDGDPLIKWTGPEEAFEAWKEATRGRPCDYTGLSYGKLRGGSGIQWPCNEEYPDGKLRLYDEGRFLTDTEVCETFGHELLTGAANTEADHRSMRPDGRAFLKAAEYHAPHEWAREDYPLIYTTGRTIYHFHTRTKTARAPQLQEAAPDVWAELAPADAESLGVGEGDLVRVESPRGYLEARARIGGVKEGVVFVPFHYGYFDHAEGRSGGGGPDGRPRAANELTVTEWDPVSKQPIFKVAAVRVTKVADADGAISAAPTTAASAPVVDGSVPATAGRKDAEATETVKEER